MSEQLLLFAEPLRTEGQLEDQLKDVKLQVDNVRKGLFQRYTYLKDDITELKDDLRQIRLFLEINEQKDYTFKI